MCAVLFFVAHELLLVGHQSNNVHMWESVEYVLHSGRDGLNSMHF